jgi:hypothetical protein
VSARRSLTSCRVPGTCACVLWSWGAHVSMWVPACVSMGLRISPRSHVFPATTSPGVCHRVYVCPCICHRAWAPGQSNPPPGNTSGRDWESATSSQRAPMAQQAALPLDMNPPLSRFLGRCSGRGARRLSGARAPPGPSGPCCSPASPLGALR